MAMTIKKSVKIQRKRPSEYAKEYLEKHGRISKIGQWLIDNPEGIATVLDRRAVNK